MTVWGADVAELERLAALIETKVGEISRIRRSLGRQMHAVPWVGKGADRFRLQWDGPHSTNLARAERALSEAAANVRRQAAEQRQASSASGGDASARRPIRLPWFRPNPIDLRRRRIFFEMPWRWARPILRYFPHRDFDIVLPQPIELRRPARFIVPPQLPWESDMWEIERRSPERYVSIVGRIIPPFTYDEPRRVESFGATRPFLLSDRFVGGAIHGTP